MKKLFPKSDEFYVGYLPEAPKETAFIIRKVISISIVITIIIVSILVWCQKEFSSSNFEYGVNTEVEGYIFIEPIPHLLVPLGKDIDGKEIYQTVLLVGSGKAGASETIYQLEKNLPKKLNGSNVRLNGYLIYGDGKALLQIDLENNRRIKFSDNILQIASEEYGLKDITIQGEIVDPKCYFGVMKPGEGKAHRSCAIRCIAGGLPPVLNSDSLDYYLLVNEYNEPIHAQILNIVGDHITLTGKALEWNDWKILRIDTKSIQQLSYEKKWREKRMTFEEGITLCSNSIKQ